MYITSCSRQTSTKIKNIHEPVIDRYFSSLNAHNFEEVSQLFSSQGCLYPPFEQGICGRDAICQYLQTEGAGIEAFPQSITIQYFGGNQTKIVKKPKGSSKSNPSA